MPNTTNYNWATPADTDLVKDGAAAIRTLGSSADTTVKNLNPGTTAGDIDYYTSSTAKARVAIGTAGQVLRVNSGGTAPEWATTADQTPLTTKGDLFGFDTADARIPVGANGHILTADSTQALGLKWAAPAASSFTKISTTTFSNVATQDIDSVFSSTYNTYLINIFQVTAASQADDLHLQMRYSTNTQAANYDGSLDVMSYLGTSTITGSSGAAQCLLSNACGAGAFPTSTNFYIDLTSGGGSSTRAHIYGQGVNALDAAFNSFGYQNSVLRVYSGFRLKSSTSNISGTVVVYGLEK